MNTEPFTLFQPFASQLQIGLFRKEDVIQSDTNTAQALGFTKVAALHQVHGSRVIIVREETKRTQEADGMLTDTSDLALCIRMADCQTFALYAPSANVIGILHAGWKGLLQGAIPSFLKTFDQEWSIDPADILIAAGPSLCKKCSDFTDPERELPTMPSKYIDGRHADLQSWATQQFFDLGVTPDHFKRHPDCTRCNPEKYWTYRGGDREEVKAGKTNMMVIGMKIPNE